MWAHVHYASLASTQTWLAEHSSAWVVQPTLRLPAVPVFLILGLFSLWIGQPASEGRHGGLGEASFVGGTRRPRRRRGRGLL